MREWHHHDGVIVFEEGEAITKHTVVHEVANTADSLSKLILLDPTSQQFTDVIDVEAGCSVVIYLELVAVTLRLVTHVEIRDLVLQCVQVRLLDFLAAANIKACERPFFSQLSIEDFDLLLRDLDVVVLIFSEFFAVGAERVDRGVVILILVRLNLTSVLFVFDQLDLGNLLGAIILFLLLVLDREHF